MIAWRKILKIALWLVLLTGSVAGVWFALSRPTVVQTARPERGELVSEIFGTGTLESKIVVAVSSKIIGKVAGC